MAMLSIPPDEQVQIIRNFINWIEDENKVLNLTPLLEAQEQLPDYQKYLESED